MKKTIIVVDMQNDFVTGSLGTKEACKTVPVIEKLLKENQENQIIFTQDTHHEDYLSTSEGKMLPVEHCMKGTKGWEIIPELKEWTHQAIMVEKPTFGSLKLPQLISQNQPEQIVLVGVCSDICVISNALILKAYFPTTIAQITFNMLPVFLAMLTHRDAMIKNAFEYIKNIVLLMVYTYYYKC